MTAARSRLATAAAVMALGALSGCGGGDEGPSKEDFVKEADSICRAAELELAQLTAGSVADIEKPRPQEAQTLLNHSVVALRSRLEQLRALDKPSGDDDEIEAIFDTWENGVEEMAGATADPRKALDLLGARVSPLQPGSALARAYGLRDCSML